MAEVASMATFSVGYIARPIGSLAVGHWGDTVGRRKVIILSLLLMGMATACIGLLPNEGRFSMYSPFILVVLRFIQGFAVATEIPSSGTLLLEVSPEKERAYYGSFVSRGAHAGHLLAAAIFLPLYHYLPALEFTQWGWRIPFFASFFLVLLGVWMRRHLDETPYFKELLEQKAINMAPILNVFKHHWRSVTKVTLMVFISIIPMLVATFGATYGISKNYGINLPNSLFLWIIVISNVLAILIIPFYARLEDRVGVVEYSSQA